MTRASLVATLLLGLASAVQAEEHKGKIAGWAMPDEGFARARTERKAALVVFSASWCGYCRQLAQGAFSDPGVVQAAAGLVPIYVDCSADGAFPELRQKYSVSGYPTVVFADPSGAPIERMNERDAPGVKAHMDQIVARFAPAPRAPRKPGSTEAAPPVELSPPGARVPVTEATTIEEGLAKAREDNKLLAVIYTDDAQVARQQAVERVLTALQAPGLDQLPERFTWVRRPVSDDVGLPTAEAEAHDASRSPTVVLFDPWAEAPAGRPFPSLETEDDLKKLRAALEKATLDAARAGHPPKARPKPPAQPEPPAPPTTASPRGR